MRLPLALRGTIRAGDPRLRKEAAVSASMPDQDERRKQELEERTRRAWETYRASLRDLEGREYEEAEHRSWERLQRKLSEAEHQPADSSGPTGPPRRRWTDH
jgi:hypothetical protein